MQNTQEAIEADFQDYYGKTTLDRGTDPQKLYNLKFEVEELGVFTPEDVNEFARLFVIEKAPGQKISPLFTKIIQNKFAKLSEEKQDQFRAALRRYVSQSHLSGRFWDHSPVIQQGRGFWRD